MHKVTARIWRPQRFVDFLGQDYIIHTLKNALKIKHIAHGYLFIGTRGVGKTSCARVFAKALNCKNLSSEFEPCLECSSCLEIKEGISADVIELDAASNRGIEDIRTLRDSMHLMPVSSSYKVYILDEVHMLTNESFNAILKILEEPPRHVVFIFATTEGQKVKDTIRSRCQQFFFRQVASKEIAQQLEIIAKEDSISYEKEALVAIADAGNGSVRDAQSIFDQMVVYGGDRGIVLSDVYQILGLYKPTYVLDILDAIAKLDAVYLYKFSEEFYFQGENIRNLIDQLVEVLKKVLFLHYHVEEILNSLHHDEKDRFFHLKEKFNPYVCQRMIEFFIDFSLKIKHIDHSLSIIHDLFLRVLDYPNWIPHRVIINRLKQLENSILNQSPMLSTENISSNIEDLKSFHKVGEDKSKIDITYTNIRKILLDYYYQDPKKMSILNTIVRGELQDCILCLVFLKEEDLYCFDDLFQGEILNLMKEKNIAIEQIKVQVDSINLKDSTQIVQQKKQPTIQQKDVLELENEFEVILRQDFGGQEIE